MKGRNPQLIKLRNEHLIKRYYYWYELERKRLDDVLERLSLKEVFLDTDYILLIIRQNHHLVKEIKSRRPKPSQLDAFIFEATEEPAFIQQALFN
ncbi:MAG: hypothetical protein Q8K66_13215 [Sediminibacterium sp.]|nr:hypothetical protein [Sediminibacterium sp.]MDP3128805.1 hypothetical protein [Sediminibacterium sp.]